MPIHSWEYRVPVVGGHEIRTLETTSVDAYEIAGVVACAHNLPIEAVTVRRIT